MLFNDLEEAAMDLARSPCSKAVHTIRALGASMTGVGRQFSDSGSEGKAELKLQAGTDGSRVRARY